MVRDFIKGRSKGREEIRKWDNHIYTLGFSKRFYFGNRLIDIEFSGIILSKILGYIVRRE
jgi:hypothetical protein